MYIKNFEKKWNLIQEMRKRENYPTFAVDIFCPCDKEHLDKLIEYLSEKNIQFMATIQFKLDPNDEKEMRDYMMGR